MSVYISEVSEGGGGLDDFVEVAVPQGLDVSGFRLVVYDDAGRVQDGPFGFPALASSVAGQDVYLFDDASVGLGSFSLNDGIALIDATGMVAQFVSFDGTVITATEGPAVGASSTSIGTHDSGFSLQTGDGGATYLVEARPNPGVLPCFAPGTRIETPLGLRAVALLRPGDLVVTRDHGPLPVRFVHHRPGPTGPTRATGQTGQTGPGSHERAPILIRAGALGPGRPVHDLVVSGQHRILAGGGGQLMGSFEVECLVPAKALLGLPRVRMMRGRRRMDWWHFALETHALVLAEGSWVETLFVGPVVLPGFSALQRRHLAALGDPAQASRGSGPGPGSGSDEASARPLIGAATARRKIAALRPGRASVRSPCH